MPNPRAQRQVALNSAVDNLKQLAVPAQALGDMLASTLRGSTAATLGVGGDIRELIDLFGPEAVEKVLGKRVMPTTEEMKQVLPKATSYEHPYESIGEFLPLPGTGSALKAAGYGLGRAAGTGTRAVGQAVSDAMIHQAGPLAKGPLSGLAPRMAMTNVVKPKGGNWLTGSVEKTINPLKRNEKAAENLEEMKRVYPPEALAAMSQETRAQVDRAIPRLEQQVALNKWVDSNLGGYMKKEMGTPEDPVRALFEKRTQDIEAQYAKEMQKVERLQQRAQNEVDPRRAANLMRESQRVAEDAASERDLLMKHITHFPANEIEFANAWVPEALGMKRFNAGYPATGMGESPAAKAWETMADNAIYGNTAENYRQPLTPSEVRRGLESVVDQNPWLTKLDPETMVYHPEGTVADMGIDHVVDVLRQDIEAGRIRPDQLNKVSMADAVKRAAEFDLEQARKMRETVLQQQSGFPIHKDYGDEGYKWIELAPSKEKKTYTAENLPEGFELERDRDGYYQVRNRNVGQTPTTDSFSRNPEEAIAKFNNWAKNKDFDLEKALKYEGDTMGHCVGGYCPDVLEGRSRIFSLRDKRGEPHVTVEVSPQDVRAYDQAIHALPDDALYAHGQLSKKLLKENPSWNYGDADRVAYEQLHGRLPERIAQIKGKQNKAPKEDYLPYVQDFVRGGEWSDVGDLHNTGLIDMSKSAIPWSKNIQPEQIDQLVGGMEGGTDAPRYKRPSELTDKFLKEANKRYVTQQEFDDFLLKELMPDEGMATGGTPRPPTEAERETLRKLRESLAPAATEAERQKRLQHNLEQMNRKVSFSDNPDAMRMELDEVNMAGGGLTKLAKLARAPAKTKAEIEAIAHRMAPQVRGEYVRESEKSAKTVAGKTQKQFQREKDLPLDIRANKEERIPEPIDIEKLKGEVMIGIPGDFTVAGKTLHGVGDVRLEMPSPQHGGPLYGLYHDDNHFWASGLDAAKKVQNLARSASEQYDAPVLGNYIMMGPDSLNYAQHFADANLQAIDLSKMTKRQIEDFNKLIREGYNYKKKGEHLQRVFPAFPGIEDKSSAYLHMALDPDLRKHFNDLMQRSKVIEEHNLPSGQDIRYGITEPALRDMEAGVTGYSMGRMRPDISAEDLKLSEHPTYSHDIPGHFLGQSKYPTPYELSFPDMVKSIRENPRQAPHEFGTLQYSGPHQTIDQQLIDEIRQYEEMMKALTGKADGGEITVKPKKMANGGEITAEDLEIEERPL